MVAYVTSWLHNRGIPFERQPVVNEQENVIASLPAPRGGRASSPAVIGGQGRDGHHQKQEQAENGKARPGHDGYLQACAVSLA